MTQPTDETAATPDAPVAGGPVDPAEEAFGDRVDDVLPAERDVARVSDEPAAADAPVDTGA